MFATSATIIMIINGLQELTFWIKQTNSNTLTYFSFYDLSKIWSSLTNAPFHPCVVSVFPYSKIGIIRRLENFHKLDNPNSSNIHVFERSVVRSFKTKVLPFLLQNTTSLLKKNRFSLPSIILFYPTYNEVQNNEKRMDIYVLFLKCFVYFTSHTLFWCNSLSTFFFFLFLEPFRLTGETVHKLWGNYKRIDFRSLFFLCFVCLFHCSLLSAQRLKFL